MSLRFPHLALLLAGSALLTACGGGSSSPTPSSPPPPPPEPAVVLLAENLGTEFTPGGIAVDGTGTVYVGNRSLTQASKPSNWSQIVKIAPTGAVSNYFGTASIADGSVTATNAGFGQLLQLGFDARTQTLIALNQGRGYNDGFLEVRKITLAGAVTTLTIPEVPSLSPRIPTFAPFATAFATTVEGTLYLAAQGSAGTSGTPSNGSTRRSHRAWSSVATDNAERILFVQQEEVIRPGYGNPNQTIYETFYPADMSATGGMLSKKLYGAAVDSAGNGYIADTERHVILKVTPAGVASILAGSVNAAGSADGSATAARLNAPTQMVVDSANNLYVLDSGNFTVRRITPAGVVSTVAGVAGQNTTKAGALPGTLGSPAGLAIDASGRLYVTVDKGVLRLRLN